MRIGVIGYGYWGPNLARNFAELEGAELRWCADTKADRRALAKRRYPAVNVTADANDIFGDDAVDAVVIATPVFTHHALARQALERGKHVLVEKPMTRTVKEGEDLVALAEKKGLVLMVDHTFVYTGAVRKMKDILDVGELGDLHYLDSVRVNLGLFQHDIDVLWDLAPHDLSILTYLIHERPRSVSAIGASHTGSGFSTPLSSNDPAGWNDTSTRPFDASFAASLTKTSPGPALSAILAARFTVRPKESPSWKITGPAWIPTRAGGSPSSPTPSTMSMAASTAWPASGK